MKKKWSVLLCTLVFTTMALSVPVNAEDNDMNGVNYNDDVNTRNVTTATDTDDDNDSPWELLGLLGLAGLFGLKRRDDREEKVR